MSSRITGTLAVLAALVAGSGVASAASWAPRLGVEGGLNSGKLPSTSQLGNGDYWKFGGSAALVASWSLAPGWSLEAAPGWERQLRRGTGTIMVNGNVAAYYDQSVRFDRVMLPVRAVFRPAGSRWLLEGGVSGAWLARAHRDAEYALSAVPYAAPAAARAGRDQPDAQIFEQAGTFDSTDWTDLFERWDAVVSAGAGWDQPVLGHALRARVRWQQGLVDLSTFGDPVRLSSASATLGVLW